MSTRVAKYVLLAIGLAGAVALAAPGKRPHVDWGANSVSSDGPISFKALGAKKYLLSASGNIQAKAEGVEVQHADKATAEVVGARQFTSIKAQGNVRFTVRSAGKGQTDKATGRCDQVTVYPPNDKKPTGNERILVADLVGNVSLSMVRVEAAAPAAKPAAAEEPMTLEGEHARVWLTDEGLEGTIEGGE